MCSKYSMKGPPVATFSLATTSTKSSHFGWSFTGGSTVFDDNLCL